MIPRKNSSNETGGQAVLITVVVAVVTAICFFSFLSQNKKNAERNGFNVTNSINYRTDELVIDGCEYIVVFGYNSRNITHKANCKSKDHDHKPNPNSE